ncbi:NAC domain-containing protein 67-like [Panicum miliaceum]|uniref:NAC domain-containing protein 67-like n=1 Tax=Panicum miliaceum TaxID=4540 RepID=A0A3L6R478_PANMI|nr:NAC domain-containing protein 67-like [Panicum miliaceum]
MEASASSMASQLGLPPGFRFVPTDQEVIAYYLLARAEAGRLLLRGRGSRQKRSCAGGGTWEGQDRRKGAKGRDGERQRVRVGGEEIEWRKYALNFHEEGVKGSTGWVMHEYSITAPPSLAASPQRVYRIRLSGHGRNAQKRKRSELDCGSDDDDEEEYHYHGAPRAATLPAVAEAGYAPFAGECPPAPAQPEPVGSLPVAAAVDAGNGDPAGWTEEAGAPADGASSAATTSSDQDLPALVDGGDDWNLLSQ